MKGITARCSGFVKSVPMPGGVRYVWQVWVRAPEVSGGGSRTYWVCGKREDVEGGPSGCDAPPAAVWAVLHNPALKAGRHDAEPEAGQIGVVDDPRFVRRGEPIDYPLRKPRSCHRLAASGGHVGTVSAPKTPSLEQIRTLRDRKCPEVPSG